MLELYVLSKSTGEKIPVIVVPATKDDLDSTISWQTNWNSTYAKSLPNKVSLLREDTNELLGLMSYEANTSYLAVEILYIESAPHSNSNLLHIYGGQKKYVGIAKALLAYAIQLSMNQGFDGVLALRAKTSELVSYYSTAFGARRVSSYDPFRMIIWEDKAEEIIKNYWR